MFKPFRVTGELRERVESTYRAPIALNWGAIVAIDPTDTTAISNNVGYSALVSGSVMLATIVPGGEKELGFTLTSAIPGGVPFIERLLGISNNYQAVPVGMNIPVYRPLKGDVIGTTEFVGYLPGDTSAVGYINTALTSNFKIPCSIVGGRFRAAQSGDQTRAFFVGNTTANGAALGLFEID